MNSCRRITSATLTMMQTTLTVCRRNGPAAIVAWSIGITEVNIFGFEEKISSARFSRK